MWQMIQQPMKRSLAGIIPLVLALQALLLPTPAFADDYLQCVPFARDLSGVQIYGDAHTWWRQAKGKYERGHSPQVGAVLSLKSHGAMELGHVAVVSRIIDSRNILLSHANWSVINGRRGQIERNVAAIDVSQDNDWSEVKVWYAPIGGIGTTAYPANGFIYPGKKPKLIDEGRQWAAANISPRPPKRNLVSGADWSHVQQTASREQTGRKRPTDLIGELVGYSGG